MERNNSRYDFKFQLDYNHISNSRFGNFACNCNDKTYQENCNSNFSNSKIEYFSQLHLKKSKACIEASNYSVQQSLELLMEKNIHAKSDKLNENSIASIEDKSIWPTVERSQVTNTQSPHYIVEPTREVETYRMKVEPTYLENQYGEAKVEHLHRVNNWTHNLNDYLDPIDMGLYGNKPQRTLPVETKRLKMKVYKNQDKNNSNYASSDVMIVNWKDEMKKTDKNVYSSIFYTIQVRQPQKICEDVMMNPTIHTSQNITHQRNDIASQKRKHIFPQLKSLHQFQKRRLRDSPKHSINVNNTMLRRLDLVKNCCKFSKNECLSRKEHFYDDIQQKVHDSDIDDKIIYQEKEKEMQARNQRMRHILLEACFDKEDGRMKSKQVSSSLPSPRVARLPHLAKEGICGDHGNTFWTSQVVVENQSTNQTNDLNQKNIEFNLIDNNINKSSILLEPIAPNCITTQKQENMEVIELSGYNMVKLRVPSNQRVKDQILSAINLGSPKVQQIVHRTSEKMAHGLEEENICLDLESLHSKILCERKLKTLNVIDYKSLQNGGGTITQLEDHYRFGIYDTCNGKSMEGNISMSFNWDATSKNSQTKVKTWETKGGKENIYQNEIGCVSSKLIEEDIKNKKLPTPSVIEDQKLKVSIYNSNQPSEERNVEVQELSKIPRLFVENNSKDMIQVNTKAQEPFTELAFQSNKLLKLLGDLQVHPTRDNCCNNSSIIKATKENMTNPTPEFGYLAQYLKMKNTKAQRKKNLLIIHR